MAHPVPKNRTLMYTGSHQRFVKLSEMLFFRLEPRTRTFISLGVLACCYSEVCFIAKGYCVNTTNLTDLIDLRLHLKKHLIHRLMTCLTNCPIRIFHNAPIRRHAIATYTPLRGVFCLPESYLNKLYMSEFYLMKLYLTELLVTGSLSVKQSLRMGASS